MNLKHVHSRVFASMLTLGFFGATLAMGATSVSAQSITVTTSFPFCVNSQGFPKGRYRFNRRSQWIISIRDVNGESEELFPVRPELSNREGSQTGPMWTVGGVTFHDFEGVRTLEAVYDPISDQWFEFPVQHLPGQHNCAVSNN